MTADFIRETEGESLRFIHVVHYISVCMQIFGDQAFEDVGVSCYLITLISWETYVDAWDVANLVVR